MGDGPPQTRPRSLPPPPLLLSSFFLSQRFCLCMDQREPCQRGKRKMSEKTREELRAKFRFVQPMETSLLREWHERRQSCSWRRGNVSKFFRNTATNTVKTGTRLATLPLQEGGAVGIHQMMPMNKAFPHRDNTTQRIAIQLTKFRDMKFRDKQEEHDGNFSTADAGSRYQAGRPI